MNYHDIMCMTDAVWQKGVTLGKTVGRRNAGQVERSVIRMRLQNDHCFFALCLVVATLWNSDVEP